jgi:putative addiction module component (TIGR02574 family)
MSGVLKQIIESIKDLSPDERALVAHCLISSLESRQDEGVDAAWAELSEKRLMELKSGEVKGVSWRDIKNKVKGRDG